MTADQKPRAQFEAISWGTKTIKMVSMDGGVTYRGDPGKVGMYLEATYSGQVRAWVVSLVHRASGNRWDGPPAMLLDRAVGRLRTALIQVGNAARGAG